MIIKQDRISANRFVALVSFIHSPANHVKARGKDNKDFDIMIAGLQSVKVSHIHDKDGMPLGATYDVSVVVIDSYHPAKGDGWSECNVISIKRERVFPILEIVHPSFAQ